MRSIAIGLTTWLISAAVGAAPSSSAPTVRERNLGNESGTRRTGSRVFETADVAARVGPVGAALRVGMILHHSDDIDASGDHENSYIEGGFAFVATPATLEPQAHFEYLPVPFLVLRGEFAAIRYLGVNYGLLNFESPEAEFGDQVLSARRGEEERAWGLRAGFSVTPRVKLGRVLLRSKLSAAAYRFDQPGPYVYEADLDTLLGTSDLVLANRTDLLFELYDGPGAETLLLGPTVEARRTIDSALSRVRVGAALWYVPSERWGNLHQPRLYAQAGLNVVDPNRRGEPFSSAGFGADFN